MILIDTSAWIEFLRRDGDPRIKRRVARYVEIAEAAHCPPVEFELMSGVGPSELADTLIALELSGPLEFPPDCWREAAAIAVQLRQRRVIVPLDDVLVAAAAIFHDVRLYAADPRFALMRDRGGLSLRLV